MSTPRTDHPARPIEMVPVTALCKFDPTGEIITVPLMGELVAPGLAITPALVDGTFQGGWTFTHLPSGRCVLPRAMCLNCCRALAGKLAAAGGWTRDMDTVIADKSLEPAVKAMRKADAACDGYRCSTPYTAPKPVAELEAVAARG